MLKNHLAGIVSSYIPLVFDWRFLTNSKSFFERFDIISGLFKPLDILKNGGYPLPVIDYKKRKPYYPALKKTENDFVNYLIKIPLHPSF